MVGTTTKATARAVASNGGVNPATHAAILAAAAVAQVSAYYLQYRVVAVTGRIDL